jgi:hypothetical protein
LLMARFFVRFRWRGSREEVRGMSSLRVIQLASAGLTSGCTIADCCGHRDVAAPLRGESYTEEARTLLAVCKLCC